MIFNKIKVILSDNSSKKEETAQILNHTFRRTFQPGVLYFYTLMLWNSEYICDDLKVTYVYINEFIYTHRTSRVFKLNFVTVDFFA